MFWFYNTANSVCAANVLYTYLKTGSIVKKMKFTFTAHLSMK